MKRKTVWWFVVLAILAIAAVYSIVMSLIVFGPTSTLTPTPEPTITRIQTPTPVPTPTPEPTPTLLSLQLPGCEGVIVHALCLVVEQSYPEIEGKAPEPIADTAQRILARVGVQIVGEGTPCDATLTVTLSGWALGATYMPAGYCYSGAKVEGEVHLAVPGREPFTLPISASNPLPDTIWGCDREPIDASFDLVWPDALLDGLARLWGPCILIQALGDEDEHVWWSAVDALVEMGPEVVPLLIQALGDEDEWVREDAAEALKEITGQDFGQNAAAWQEWWEEQE